MLKSREKHVYLKLQKSDEPIKYCNRLKDYVKEAQRTMEISEWLKLFSAIILNAQQNAKAMVRFTLTKAQFFYKYQHLLNERQLKVVRKMLEKGLDGFEGGMTAKKYISITKTSKASATRDLQDLQAIGVFVQLGAGRSIRYNLNIG
jgi:Fic family protein